MKRFLGTTFLAALLVVFFANVSSAAALTLSPARRIITIDPGTTQDLKVTVTNNDASTVRLQLLVTGLQQDPTGKPIFGSGLDDAEKWVVPAPEPIVLAPGKQATAAFKISVPRGALPGSHWVGLVVESRPDSTGTAVLTPRLISLLSIQVAGVVTESVTVSADVPHPVVFGAKPFDAKIRIQNVGTIEVPLRGRVTVRSLGGKEIDAKDISLGNQVLPQSERLVVEKITATKKDTCAVEGTVCAKLFWPGLYKMSVQVTYGKTGQVAISETSFWYFSYWSLAVAVLILVSIAWFIRRLRQRSIVKKYVA